MLTLLLLALTSLLSLLQLLLAAVAAEDRSGALFFVLTEKYAEADVPSTELVRCAALAQVRDERGASNLLRNKARDADQVSRPVRVLMSAALRPGAVGVEARRVCGLYQCALLAGNVKGSAAAMQYTEQLMEGATRAITAAQKQGGDGQVALSETVGALLPMWLSAAYAKKILHPAAVPLLQALDDLKVRAHTHHLAMERCTEDRHVAIHTPRAMLRSSDTAGAR